MRPHAAAHALLLVGLASGCARPPVSPSAPRDGAAPARHAPPEPTLAMPATDARAPEDAPLPDAPDPAPGSQGEPTAEELGEELRALQIEALGSHDALQHPALPQRDGAGQPPPVRTHGGLTIHEPPRVRTESARGFVTRDVVGPLNASGVRTWVGPSVPVHVPAGIDALELTLLVPTAAGHFALYREPFADGAQPGCDPNHRSENCRTLGRLYLDDGTLAAEVDFDALMHRTTHLRVSDIALVDRMLYFAEACQTYASEAKGACSDVVALDLARPPSQVRWRSRFLVSNAPLLVVGDFLVTGYGFTREPDFVHVLDRHTGKVVLSTSLPKAPEGFEVKGDVLEVLVYGREAPLRFTMANFARPPGWPAKKLLPPPRLTPRP